MTSLLVDGTNLLMRAVFAARSRSGTSGVAAPMMSSSGENTAALVIFMGMLTTYVREVQPDRILVAFDSDEKSWRTAYLPEYKASRGEKDRSDVPLDQVREFLDLLGISHCSQDGFEADDMVAAAAMKCWDEDDVVVVLSGDKDLMQLLQDDLTIQIRPGNAKGEVWDAQRLTQEIVPPAKYAAFLALAGDVGDGIAGVRGIGKIKAVQILSAYDGDLYYLPLPERWAAAEHRDAYRNSLKCTDLVQDWAAMGMIDVRAEPYPIYPDRTTALSDFLERYSLRMLSEKVDQGVLWRDHPVVTEKDLEGLSVEG